MEPITVLTESPFSYFQLQPPRKEGEFFIDALGGKTRAKYLAGMPPGRPPGAFQPEVGEAIFEWAEVLRAVQLASGSFTMIELGAGWARWLVFAGLAMRQSKQLPVSLLGVEAEPTHFKWAKQHLRDNNLRGHLHRAVIAADDGEALFFTGRPAAWYGQAVAPPSCTKTPLTTQMRRILTRQPRQNEDAVESVKKMSFAGLLSDLENVDLIHSDIQGSEGEVFPATIDLLDAKVRRLIIGTHSPSIEDHLREVFTSHGWLSVHDYGTLSRSATPYGEVEFLDGLQVWSNPRLDSPDP